MKYNISKARNYTKDGQEKTFWDTVGTINILENPKGKVAGFVNIPLIGEFQLFVDTPKKQEESALNTVAEQNKAFDIVEFNEQVSPEDIPF